MPKAKAKHGVREIPAFEPGADAIERLEEALADAKAGKVSQVAIAITGRDGLARWSFSELHRSASMLGAIELLKAQIINNVMGD